MCSLGQWGEICSVGDKSTTVEEKFDRRREVCLAYRRELHQRIGETRAAQEEIRGVDLSGHSNFGTLRLVPGWLPPGRT